MMAGSVLLRLLLVVLVMQLVHQRHWLKSTRHHQMEMVE